MILFKGKLEDNNYIELPLETILDIELLESGTPYDEEMIKTFKERLGKCFSPEINFEAIDKEYGDMLERVKEKLKND